MNREISAEQQRYSAHYSLPSIGPEGQQRINEARVVLVGLGGLGCAAAQYLVSSGVGRLTLCDFDTVTTSNLARQILFAPGDTGRKKTEVARTVLRFQNPDVVIRTVEARVGDEELDRLLPECDLVLDASDNYGTRLAVNRACRRHLRPWVMGSAIRMEGQLILFQPAEPGAPCYRCIYGQAPDTLEDCPGAGIFAPVAGVIGAAMSHLGLSLLAGQPAPSGLQVLDAQLWQWRRLAAQRNPACRDCGSD